MVADICAERTARRGGDAEVRGGGPARGARRLALASLVALVLAGCRGPAPDEDVPALVVLVVVDQLRADLLDRYDVLFTGGIRRLMDDGHRFAEASHRHAMTETAPGHASLVTGVHPSRYGLVANTWTEVVDGVLQPVQSTADTLASVPGFPYVPGGSPRQLLRDGLPDWMVRQNPDTRVVSVSRKEVGAVVLGGRTGGHVYWLAPLEGVFVTSTFYRDAPPDWVDRFNRYAVPVLMGDPVWESTIPPGAESMARRPDFPHAGDGVDLTLPLHFHPRGEGAPSEAFNLWVADTPMPDRATAELAKLAVRELGLGATLTARLFMSARDGARARSPDGLHPNAGATRWRGRACART